MVERDKKDKDKGKEKEKGTAKAKAKGKVNKKPETIHPNSRKATQMQRAHLRTGKLAYDRTKRSLLQVFPLCTLFPSLCGYIGMI